jgi:hypothetical protein
VPGYSQIQYSALQTQLSSRLNDLSNRFWTASEIQTYLIEALRTWQAFSQFYSTNITVNLTASTLYYDLAVNATLAPTVTDQQLIQLIQQHLQEPVSVTSWTGTEQFTFDQVVRAIERRRNQFKLESGLGLSFSEFAQTNTAQVSLADAVIDIRRVMWKDQAGIYYILWPTDNFALTSESNSWFTTPGVPIDYSTILNKPLTIQLAPPPAANGFINLVSVNSLTDLNPVGGATILGVLDDFSWVVKFGALADLFGQPGQGNDPQRSSYCESRWRDGITLARITNIARFGYIGNNPTFIDSVEELDATNSGWMNLTPSAAPNTIAAMGNLVVVSPISTGAGTIAFDVTPPMPLPVLSTDYIQVGKEAVDVILDYAQHLAEFKEGNVDTRVYENLLRLAMLQNDRLRANANDFDVLSDRSRREEKERLRRKSDLDIATIGAQQ